MKKSIGILMMVIVLFTINVSAQNEYEIKKIGPNTILVPDTIKIGKFSCSHEIKQKYEEKKIIEAWLNSRVEVDSKSLYNYSPWGTYKQEIVTKTFLVKKGNTIVEEVSPPMYNAWQFAWKTILFWIIALLGGFIYTKSLYKTINKTQCFEVRHFILYTIIIVLALTGTGAITIACKSTDIFSALKEFLHKGGVITDIYYNQTLGFICIGTGIITIILAYLFNQIFSDDNEDNPFNIHNLYLFSGFCTGISIGWFVSIVIVNGQWLPLIIVILLLGIGTLLGYLYEN